ncbi:DMT family transporter [Bacillus kexueae]|uniref:DMT family transporter n=1 Tax=Aeribacillus kexueae TaxID=2078952 RepID=UPI001FAF0E66|nr:multidrug efflux SMR transporter [Bacillus kexueae]
MAWLSLVGAGLFEVVGVIGITLINRKGGMWPILLLLFGMICSFTLLTLSMGTIPMGTAYAVWTGIGTAGSAVVGIWLFKEPADFKRLFFIAVVIVAVVGLKFIS